MVCSWCIRVFVIVVFACDVFVKCVRVCGVCVCVCVCVVCSWRMFVIVVCACDLLVVCACPCSWCVVVVCLWCVHDLFVTHGVLVVCS